MLPAVPAKVALVAPAAIVTDAGTVNFPLLLASVTTAPPATAADERFTVHVVAAPEARLAGAQDNEVSAAGGTSATVAVCEMPLYVAVIVAVCPLAIVP